MKVSSLTSNEIKESIKEIQANLRSNPVTHKKYFNIHHGHFYDRSSKKWLNVYLIPCRECGLNCFPFSAMVKPDTACMGFAKHLETCRVRVQ